MTSPLTRAERAACSEGCGWSDCRDDNGTCSGAESSRGDPSAGVPGAAPTAVPYGLRFCREADSVLEGFLCSEPTVVSDACRRADGGLDQFVCDDVKMQKLQKGILEQTWWAIRAMVTQLLRGFGS